MSTYDMLYPGCHGHKLMRICLPVLWDELCIGNTEDSSKIYSAVALPAN